MRVTVGAFPRLFPSLKSIKLAPDAQFWAAFLLLNFALFLPFYLFNRADAAFWPLVGVNGSPRLLLERLFLQRPNPDIFRLNLELILLIALWLFLPFVRRKLALALFFLLYLLQLIYAVYEAFIRSYYLLDPVLYNDIFLFRAGVGYVLRSLGVSPALYGGAFLLLVGLIGLLWGLHRLLLIGRSPDQLSRPTRWGVVGLALLALLSVSWFKDGAGWPETAVSSFTAKLSQNLDLSRQSAASAARFANDRLPSFYQLDDLELDHKPNVHLIFIESYGSILYKRPDLRLPYQMMLSLLEYRLGVAGWSAASSRSLSPTWGGGSWIAYTSALTGLQLTSHLDYLLLLNRYQQTPFPHLVNTLRDQGYHSYTLSTHSQPLNDIEWGRYKSFYGMDEWPRFTDLPYTGPLYGWGPAPPDQFALHYATDSLKGRGLEPYVFFYITQNSHYPWTPLPPLVADWRSLNEAPPPETAVTSELRPLYLAAILYQLEMLADWIIQQGDEGDLFVLIGDHQPARVANYGDGWDTPLHIISQDKAVVAALLDLGFQPGLGTYGLEPTLHHSGLYSLLLRLFLQQGGANPANLPEFQPEGVIIEVDS
jgi:hypothetical protein